MQDILVIAALMREISFGILLAGLFYTFGMFFLGRLFSAISEHSHEAEHDVDHNVEHDVEKDYDHDVDHDIEHDVDHDIDHDVEHDIEKDFDHDVEHDLDHHVEVDHDLDHDVEHDVEKDIDHSHDTEHDSEHEVEVDHGIEKDHSGFFELDRGAPLGVTIGTSLVLFGFIGSVVYYEGILLPFVAKMMIQLGGTFLLVWTMRSILGRIFVESGFNIKPQHLVGLEVKAVSTVRDDFGEIRAETEMGLRRFHARPFQKGVIFEKGTDLFVISADEKFVYVDPRKEAVKWVQKQSKDKEKTEA
ncbi:MAG: hypothetical protein ACTSUZ_01280 [Candidatus Thorarchaeota archaeon]